MCGRFAVGDTRGDDWADWLGIDADSPWPEPSRSIAPTQMAGNVGQGNRGRSLAQALIAGEKLLSFTVLTCPAGEATRHLHPCSPVVLTEADWARWLIPGSDVADLMRPAANDRVVLREVGSAVGNARNNGPELIEPLDLNDREPLSGSTPAFRSRIIDPYH